MVFEALYASFIATMSFGILFNVPRKTLLSSGLTGMLSWMFYLFLTVEFKISMTVATLLSAFAVAIIAQLLARLHQTPASIFTISGIIPFVPGGLAYDTIVQFVNDNYIEGLRLGSMTLLSAGAIAFGLILSGVISELFVREKPVRSDTLEPGDSA